MGERSAELPEPLRAWLDTDRDSDGVAARLAALENLVTYWVPISTERDLRLATIEARLAAIEAGDIGEYPCVADLADRVATLEATVWELRRRLGMS